MAFKNSQKSRVLVGSTHYSGYTRQFGIDIAVDTQDVTTLLDEAKQFIVGQDTATLSVGMVLDTDTTANGQWSNATTWKSTQPAALSFAPAGFAALSEAFLVSAIQTEFASSSAVAGVAEASIAAQCDGIIDAGYSLEDLADVTVDATGTARDLTASSTNGGVAHLHVTAFSGLTSDAITIEHSVDGVGSWATLATFATVTGVTSERVVVAPATTVRRYLRVIDDVTGTGSVTRQVSFARR